MLKNKITTIIAVTMLSVMAINGVGTLEGIIKPIEVQAEVQTYAMETPTGTISGKITYEDNIPDNPTVDQLKAMSISINPTDNPEFFWINPITNQVALNSAEIYLSNNIYNYSYYDSEWNQQVDYFIKVLKIERSDKQGYVSQTTSTASFVDGVGSVTRNSIYTGQNYKAYNAILEEETPAPPTEVPTPPEEKPQQKVIRRFAGADRYLTATSIANEVTNGNLTSVVLAAGLDFPDALSGSVLASKNNAPILPIRNTAEGSQISLDYIKNKLPKDGKIYLLGGESVVTNSVVENLRASGYSNFTRLGGLNRYETNRIINKELNITKGTDVMIATASNFADALSISGVAGAKQMPIYLVGNDIDEATLNDIRNISPNNIYIAGATGAVSSGIENKLRGITGNITRFDGINRYETSLKVANHFGANGSVLVAYGLDFPDALTGSVLAAKTNSPILLVPKTGDVSSQKNFINEKNVTNINVVGSTGVVSDQVANDLLK